MSLQLYRRRGNAPIGALVSIVITVMVLAGAAQPAACQNSRTSAHYALYGISYGILNGSGIMVAGDVGTNGYFTVNGFPDIQGNVDFNGPAAGWQNPPSGAYSVLFNPQPVFWPTVDSIANANFPSGGLTWLAGHNDNALAVPPFWNSFVQMNGNAVLTLKGKPGGANYYLTGLMCTGNARIYFDNTNGPITIWIGPREVYSAFILNGGAAAMRLSQDPAKAVRIYVATANDVNLGGASELDAGIYDYDGAWGGRVILNGNPTVNGAILSNMFLLNGSPTILYGAGSLN